MILADWSQWLILPALSTFIPQIQYNTLANFRWNCILPVMQTRKSMRNKISKPFLLPFFFNPVAECFTRRKCSLMHISSIIWYLFTAAETAGECKLKRANTSVQFTPKNKTANILFQRTFFSFVFPCFCSLGIGGNLCQGYSGGYASMRTACRPTPTSITLCSHHSYTAGTEN